MRRSGLRSREQSPRQEAGRHLPIGLRPRRSRAFRRRSGFDRGFRLHRIPIRSGDDRADHRKAARDRFDEYEADALGGAAPKNRAHIALDLTLEIAKIATPYFRGGEL